MICTNCHGNISAWLKKYRETKKVRLDEQYFKDEKLVARYDESGVFIDGERFYEHESKRCFERCPKCGSKNSMDIEEEGIIWAPI